jgi:hypothetical protein
VAHRTRRSQRPVHDQLYNEALIVAPAPGSLAGASVEIWGWAWAAAGVTKLEVSVDGGGTWSPSRLEDRRQWSWQRFAFDWRPGGNGSFTLPHG